MKKAFTLVELIVVITILAILGTIGFISLQGYSMQARDAKRISDVSSLSSKINIEQIRGLDLKDLIKETREEEGQILGIPNQRVNTFGKINFDNLREQRSNFLDPSTKDDYKGAYAIGIGSGGLRYNFFELGTISEKEGKNKIVGNYYTLTQEDIPSLFLSGSIEYINNGEELIYEVNNNSNNDEEDNKVFGYFTFNTSTQTITSYSNDGPKDVIIPNHINGVDVKIIGSYAFSDKGLRSVIIPEGIDIIGSRAFYLNQLTEVIIPEGVTTIGPRAFRNNQLTEAIIPNSVEMIGSYAFGNNELTEVIIPSNITSISEGTFENNQLMSIEIPSSIEIIGGRAFYNNQLVNILIPEGVTSIGNWAFRYNQLIEIIILNGTMTIGSNVFTNQTNSTGNGVINAPQEICDTYYAPSTSYFDKTKLLSCTQ